MKRKQITKLLIFLIFISGFIAAGLLLYKGLVKKNSFKPEQFGNGK